MVNSRLSVIVVKIAGDSVYHHLKIQFVNVWSICSHDDTVIQRSGCWRVSCNCCSRYAICNTFYLLLQNAINNNTCLISCFQLNALVYYIFSYSSTCFEPYCAHHQEDLLYIHTIWFFMCHSSCVTVRCTGS